MHSTGQLRHRSKSKNVLPAASSAGGARVILMHDSGGNRKPTVAALPLIIDRLSEQGFKFVTLHELIGKERGDVMPVVGGQLSVKTGLDIRLRLHDEHYGV